ncbi:hypothetical protein FRC02_003464 [Tulasnella sp. 418]|nr:hypothetical protein FRC02_003464 [Tulasnella sp. 418]
MDIFGTVSAAIGLVEKVKAIFDQVDQNKHDCAVFSAEIVKSLSSVQQFWQQNGSCPPPELRDGLSEFESDLRNINASLASLLKPAKDGVLANSIAKLNEIYNVNEIKNELVSLDRKVQRCHRDLQTWGTVRTESRVTAMHEDMIAQLEELRMLLPGSNPQRQETLGRIEAELPDQIRGIDPGGALQLKLSRAQSRHSLLVAPSIKSARSSIRSFSPSFVDRQYLKDKVKEISKTLPQACDQVSRACDMLHAILRQEQAYFNARSSGEATEEMIRQVNASYEALYDFCLEELGSRLGPFFYDHIADRAHMIYPSWCLWISNNIMSHVFRREDSPIDQ